MVKKLQHLFYKVFQNPYLDASRIKNVKEYLRKEVTSYNGYLVIAWHFVKDEIHIDILAGKARRIFFGFLDDIATLCQEGFFKRK